MLSPRRSYAPIGAHVCAPTEGRIINAVVLINFNVKVLAIIEVVEVVLAVVPNNSRINLRAHPDGFFNFFFLLWWYRLTGLFLDEDIFEVI